MPTARDGIEFLKARVESHIAPVDLPDFLGSSGFAVSVGEDAFAVVSVERDAPEHFAITSGLFKGVTSDRLTVLGYCNTETANNPSSPIYCHGSEVLTQVKMPLAIIGRIPELLSIRVAEAPRYAINQRVAWQRDGIDGQPFRWSDEDLQLVFRKATSAVM